jgi:hypothetical protein
MAHIKQLPNGKWRAQIEKYGQRPSKVVDTEPEAHIWAAHMEALLEAKAKRYKPKDALAIAGPDLVTMVPKRVLDACREIPHRQVDILEAAIPLRRNSAVYFLLRDGDVIYVGQSSDVMARISRHRREGKQFDSFAYMECEPEELDRLESLYINAFVPPENLTFGNHREPGLSPRTKRRARLTVAKADSLGLT